MEPPPPPPAASRLLELPPELLRAVAARAAPDRAALAALASTCRAARDACGSDEALAALEARLRARHPSAGAGGLLREAVRANLGALAARLAGRDRSELFHGMCVALHLGRAGAFRCLARAHGPLGAHGTAHLLTVATARPWPSERPGLRGLEKAARAAAAAAPAAVVDAAAAAAWLEQHSAEDARRRREAEARALERAARAADERDERRARKRART